MPYYGFISCEQQQQSLHLLAFQLAVLNGYAVRCSFLCLECKFLVAVEDVARCATVRLYYSLNKLAFLPCDVKFKATLGAQSFNASLLPY